jgi:hypothetical protein
VAAAVADAATSNLTIKTKNPQGPNARINGDLTSSDPSCVEGTRVKLHFDAPGAPKHFSVVGTDKARKSGRWKVGFGLQIPPGKYYASVAKDGVCPAVKTTTIKVTPPH